MTVDKYELNRIELKVFPDHRDDAQLGYELKKGNKDMRMHQKTRQNLELAKQLDCFKEYDLFLMSDVELVPPGQSVKKRVDACYLENLPEGQFLLVVKAKRKKDEFFLTGMVSKRY